MLAGWSMIGNTVIEGANYLYLMKNGLPFDLFKFLNWKYSYLIDYALLVTVITLISILPFVIRDKIEKENKTSFDIIMNTLQDKNFA